MFFFLSLLPTTLVVIVGYFILFSSNKTEGAVRTFGQVLAIWLFILAAAFPIAGAYAMYSGLSLDTMRSMHSGR